MRETSSNGCGWGRETRVMVDSVERTLREVKKMINDQGKQINELFNHQSKKPSWFVALVLTALCTVCGSLIVYTVTHNVKEELPHSPMMELMETESAPVK